MWNFNQTLYINKEAQSFFVVYTVTNLTTKMTFLFASVSTTS